MLTWVEISRKAIEHNIRSYKKLIGNSSKLLAVIKANAYGHGFLEVAKICDKHPDIFRIASVSSDEAKVLIENRINKRIQILSFFDYDKDVIASLVTNDVVFPLYSEKQAFLLNTVGKALGKKVAVHLKIDTGTSRLGIYPSQVGIFLDNIKKYHNLEIEGIWSHFASSESDAAYTKHQIAQFYLACDNLEKKDVIPFYKHMACSAAAMLDLKNFNMVRLGIGLYGLHPSTHAKEKITLKPALSWHTKVIHVKLVDRGVKIGYGGTYVTRKKTKIVTLPIGYCDGYDRSLSNIGKVIINGNLCPVRGRICMNLTMVEAPKEANIKIGDEVILIGKKGKLVINADDLAEAIETINYEIVDRINPTIPRIVK